MWSSSAVHDEKWSSNSKQASDLEMSTATQPQTKLQRVLALPQTERRITPLTRVLAFLHTSSLVAALAFDMMFFFGVLMQRSRPIQNPALDNLYAIAGSVGMERFLRYRIGSWCTSLMAVVLLVLFLNQLGVAGFLIFGRQKKSVQAHRVLVLWRFAYLGVMVLYDILVLAHALTLPAYVRHPDGRLALAYWVILCASLCVSVLAYLYTPHRRPTHEPLRNVKLNPHTTAGIRASHHFRVRAQSVPSLQLAHIPTYRKALHGEQRMYDTGAEDRKRREDMW
ncbi:hypothetical protein RI367_000667 [Sorochytrium milnesiophthora]